MFNVDLADRSIYRRHLDQVTVGHEELRDEVDVVVTRGVTQLRRRGLSRPELLVESACTGMRRSG